MAQPSLQPGLPAFRDRHNWRGSWALAHRELSRFYKEKGESLAGPAVGSLLFLTVFSLALGPSSEIVPGLSVVSFVAPGVVMLALCGTAFARAAYPVLHDKHEGSIADLLSAPMSPGEILAGYASAAALAALLIGGLVLALAQVFAEFSLVSGLAVFAYALAGALLFALLGVIAGIWAERWEHYAMVESFLVLPLSFLSGAFFPLTAVPSLGAVLVQLNPAFYVVDGFRYGLTGHAESSLLLGALVLVGLISALWLLAWRLLAIGYHIKP